jgi:hypothetical protein
MNVIQGKNRNWPAFKLDSKKGIIIKVGKKTNLLTSNTPYRSSAFITRKTRKKANEKKPVVMNNSR